MGVLDDAQRACKQACGSDAKHHFEMSSPKFAEGGLYVAFFIDVLHFFYWFCLHCTLK